MLVPLLTLMSSLACWSCSLGIWLEVRLAFVSTMSLVFQEALDPAEVGELAPGYVVVVPVLAIFLPPLLPLGIGLTIRATVDSHLVTIAAATLDVSCCSCHC